jgi:hypothetical protein
MRVTVPTGQPRQLFRYRSQTHIDAVPELRLKNRTLRAKNCELIEDKRRLSAENTQHDRMMRSLISTAERVLTRVRLVSSTFSSVAWPYSAASKPAPSGQ